MVKKVIDNFSIAQICGSGQCFRMKNIGENAYCVIASGKYLKIAQYGRECLFYCDAAEFDGFWREYFDIETDYQYFIDKINPNDRYLAGAAEFGSGIRILKQDLWEMIVSFLISQQNNIVRIRKCIDNICRAYGEMRVNAEGEVYYTFPGAEVLAALDEEALKACNLGYRSKYVVRTAKSITSGAVDLEKLRHMPYKEAKMELLKLFGVGEKVADCICLFALHHLSAFPVDTHIHQVLQAHYKRGFPKRRYKGYEGVLQQYIFYYAIKSPKEILS